MPANPRHSTIGHTRKCRQQRICGIGGRTVRIARKSAAIADLRATAAHIAAAATAGTAHTKAAAVAAAAATAIVTITTASARRAVVEGTSKVGSTRAALQERARRPDNRIAAERVGGRCAPCSLGTPEAVDTKRIICSCKLRHGPAAATAATAQAATAAAAGYGIGDAANAYFTATAAAAGTTHTAFDDFYPVARSATATVGPAAEAAVAGDGGSAAPANEYRQLLAGRDRQPGIGISAAAARPKGRYRARAAGGTPHFYTQLSHPRRYRPRLHSPGVLKIEAGFGDTAAIFDDEGADKGIRRAVNSKNGLYAVLPRLAVNMAHRCSCQLTVGVIPKIPLHRLGGQKAGERKLNFTARAGRIRTYIELYRCCRQLGINNPAGQSVVTTAALQIDGSGYVAAGGCGQVRIGDGRQLSIGCVYFAVGGKSQRSRIGIGYRLSAAGNVGCSEVKLKDTVQQVAHVQVAAVGRKFDPVNTRAGRYRQAGYGRYLSAGIVKRKQVDSPKNVGVGEAAKVSAECEVTSAIDGRGACCRNHRCAADARCGHPPGQVGVVDPLPANQPVAAIVRQGSVGQFFGYVVIGDEYIFLAGHNIAQPALQVHIHQVHSQATVAAKFVHRKYIILGGIARPRHDDSCCGRGGECFGPSEQACTIGHGLVEPVPQGDSVGIKQQLAGKPVSYRGRPFAGCHGTATDFHGLPAVEIQGGIVEIPLVVLAVLCNGVC